MQAASSHEASHEANLTELATLQAATERLRHQLMDQTLELTLYDTALPVQPETGLPPVKAILKQKTKQTSRQQETSAAQATAQTRQQSQWAATGNETANAQTVEQATPAAAKLKRLLVLLIPALAAATWGIYKLVKLIKH